MQLSEFRDLLANDGFAATFQTMGQYRTELLRALDGLRAQADARQVFYVADDLTPEMVGKGCRVFMSTESFTGCTQALYTHSEASAPGLSEVLRSLDEAHSNLDLGDYARGFGACIDKLKALTRASAATVGVAEGWQLVPVKPTEQMQIAGRYATHDNAWEQARAIWGAMLAAAPTQQAEPGSDERGDAYAGVRLLDLCRRFGVKVPDGWAAETVDAARFALLGQIRGAIDRVHAGERDAIARSKSILAAVDTYCKRPDRLNRLALRSMLVDEFTELLAAQSGQRAGVAAQQEAGLVDALMAACKTLPAGYNIHLDAENGWAGVELVDPNGNSVDYSDGESSLTEQVIAATQKAIAAAPTQQQEGGL